MLELSQGNEYVLTYSIKNQDGSVKDLSGSSELKYEMAKRKVTSPIIAYTLADAELILSDAAQGKVQLTIRKEDMNLLSEGSYYHEIWHVNAIGQASTLMAEKIIISSKLIKE
jgi:hypothetical protein